jgi:glycosyltransferase involved in cell wall biosynthesis
MNAHDLTRAACRVSIIIKALNEEQRVVAAVESALAAVQTVGGEVVLADSCSSDRTVALASAYPIRIVQLAHPNERCCGVGPQLGYQHSMGNFVYILDGDMEMLPGFLPQALAFLQAHPEVAGVGGRVIEMNTSSLEYLARIERGLGHMHAGEVDRLDMGGLYRRAAIEQAGYFSDRNLHSYEEFDLAVRLRVKGWKLWRIGVDAVRHYGHDAPAYQLLVGRWRSRYICGLGEVVRAAWGQPHMKLVLTGVRELRLYVGVLVWWLVLVALLFAPITWMLRVEAFALLAMTPLLLMLWRKRSLRKAMFSVVSWCFNAAGLVRGLLASQRPARQAVDSVQIRNVEPQGLGPALNPGLLSH